VELRLGDPVALRLAGPASARAARLFGGLVVALISLYAGPLLAQTAQSLEVRIYASDDPNGIPIPTPVPGNDDPPWFVIGVGETDRDLELYIVKGDGTPSASGTVCVNADGQETCGFEVRLLAQAGLVMKTFTSAMPPAPPGDAILFKTLLSGAEVMSGNFDELRISGTKTKGPWDPSPPSQVPLHVGTLRVDTPTDPLQKSRVLVTRGRHVDARGALTRVPEHTIAAPEASQLSMLLAGAALLGILHRTRRRKLARRPCA
jgi:hypothetical protein